MEEERKAGDLAAESGGERLDSHGERRLPWRVSRRRDGGGGTGEIRSEVPTKDRVMAPE